MDRGLLTMVADVGIVQLRVQPEGVPRFLIQLRVGLHVTATFLRAVALGGGRSNGHRGQEEGVRRNFIVMELGLELDWLVRGIGLRVWCWEGRFIPCG